MLNRLILCLVLIRVCAFSVRFDINWRDLRPNDYLPTAFTSFNTHIHSVDDRIVGGLIANPHAYPYQVGLALTMTSGSGSWCGGSIISTKYILTAAHCLERAKLATVILGAHDRESKSEPGRLEIKTNRSNFIIHKGWSMNNVRNDIALIKLPYPVNFTDTIKPISLPSTSLTSKTFEGSTATISGWGSYGGKDLSKFLRYTKTKVISNQKCRQFFGNLIKDSIMCLDGSRGNGTCYGDSGGPLVIQEQKMSILAGLTSFGSRLGCQNKWPTAFTRITHYLEWLAQNTDVNIDFTSN